MTTKIKPSEPFVKNETLYQGFNVSYGKTIWSITYTHGKYNNVIVSKVSYNPFRGPGKYFDTFEEAYNNYKSEYLLNALDVTKEEFEVKNNVSIN